MNVLMLRVIFCGSRDWLDAELIEKEIKAWRRLAEHNGDELEVVVGSANGADGLTINAARKLGVGIRREDVEQRKRIGRSGAAGQNERLITDWEPDALVAFIATDDKPGTPPVGWKHMVAWDLVQRAHAAHVPTSVWNLKRHVHFDTGGGRSFVVNKYSYGDALRAANLFVDRDSIADLLDEAVIDLTERKLQLSGLVRKYPNPDLMPPEVVKQVMDLRNTIEEGKVRVRYFDTVLQRWNAAVKEAEGEKAISLVTLTQGEYEPSEHLVELLDGSPPKVTEAVRVETVPA